MRLGHRYSARGGAVWVLFWLFEEAEDMTWMDVGGSAEKRG
jgi:hypothetical protein